MATLTGNTIASTYPLLLKIDSSGVDGTLRKVEDGDATDSSLSISTTAIAIDATDKLYFDGGNNTYIHESGSDVLKFVVGGVAFLDMTEGTNALVINEGSADMDFRVESNGNANMLFVDGGNDRVGIGDATPSNLFSISSTTGPQFRITHTDDSDYATFAVDGDGQLDITTVDGGGTGGHICLIPDGDVGIGTTSPVGGFEVSNGDNVEVITRCTAETADKKTGIRMMTGANGSTIASTNSVAGILADMTQVHASALKGELQFYTNSGDSFAQRMVLDEDGYLGIGDSNPANRLTLKETTYSQDVIIKFSGKTSGGSGRSGYVGYCPDAADSNDNYVWMGGQTTTPTLAVTYEQRVGVGTTTPGAKFHVYADDTSAYTTTIEQDGTGDPALRFLTTGGTAAVIGLDNSDSDKLKFCCSSNALETNTAMTIDASGQIFMPEVYDDNTGADADMVIQSGGQLLRSTSSKRYKKDINYNGVDASIVYNMKPCSFKDKNTDKEYIGLIAEDMHEIEPRLVKYIEIDGKDEPDAIAYGHITAVLVKAIQELSAKVTALESA